MSTDHSHLVETVPTHLLDESSTYSVILHDGSGNFRRLGEVSPEAKLLDPFALDLTQFIPNPPLRLEGLVKLLGECIEDAQRREGIVQDEQIKFVQEYNPETFAELGDEVLTFKVIRRQPANMSKDGKSRPNRGWNASYEYSNAREPNKVLCVDARPIDHKLEIAAWGKTSTLANARALWLERLLIGQRWMFTSKGVNPFYWVERGPDTLWTHAGARLHQRPLQFSARLFEYTVMAYPTIREFQLHVEADSSL